MNRFSVSSCFYERILAQKAVDFGGQNYGPQLTPEQRQRSIPWLQDPRFKTDPQTGAVFFDEMFLTPEEVKEMQEGWANEEGLDKQIAEFSRKLGIEATDISHLVQPIVQKYFDSVGGKKESSKEETIAFLNNFMTKAGAPQELISASIDYLSGIFEILHYLERADHLRNTRSIKAFKNRKINAAVLTSFYKMIVRRGQVEEEWIPSASEQRTIKRLNRIWAIDELQRIKSGQTPEQFYGADSVGMPLLTREEAEAILLDTRESEDYSVPIEEMRTNIPQRSLGGEDIEPINEEVEIEKELARPRIKNTPAPEAEIDEVIAPVTEDEPEAEEEEEDALYDTKREQDEIEGEG